MSPPIPWWRQDRQRVERERDAMLRHPDMTLCRDPDRPALRFWRGRIAVGDTHLTVQAVYPPWYPDQPPAITAFDEAGEPIDYTDTLHTWPDGRPCIYTHDDGADGWHPNYTAADALDRFVEFVQRAERGEHVARYTSGVPALPGWPGRSLAIVPRSLADALARVQTRKPALGDMRASLAFDGRLRSTIRVHRLTLPGGVEREATDDERPLLPEGLPVDGIWLRWPERPDPLWAPDATFATLTGLVGRDLGRRARARLDAAPYFLASWPEGPREQRTLFENPGRFAPRLAAILDAAALPRAETHVLDGIERLGVRNRPVIGQSAATAWEQIHLLMVGLGSLGSTVAVELAKAGARHFSLFDPDLLRPENLSRHVGGVDALFRPKVEAVADRILAHNPLARPAGYICAAPECGGNAPLFHDALHRPHTLVIVTTAERHGESAINRLALAAGVPAIYGSVLGPAAHGRVFRVIPRVTPCLQCVALSQSRDPARSPRFDGRTAGAEPALPGDRYRQPALPGVSIDVGHVALHIARMALSTLARTHPTIEYPDPEHDHILCTQHGGWIFTDGEHTARPLHLRRAPDCPACGR